MTAQMSDHRTEEIDAALTELRAGAESWRALSLTGRRELLEAVGRSVAAAAQEWVSTAARYKGLDPDSPLVGEEWLSGPYAVLTALAALGESLRALEHGGSPVDGFKVGVAPGNRVTVRVMPHGIFDSLLLSGFSADVWMQPGVTADQVRAEAGLGQLTPQASGGVGLVLGAAGRALRAFRPQPGGGAEAQPGDGCDPARVPQGVCASCRCRLPADRHGGR
jgi:aldehyde dehydrogenase (NAD(P)+)